MTNTDNRSCYWDNIKGFLMILVVFAHFLYPFRDDSGMNWIVDSIYTFHMPAFVFVSGYFGKSEHSRSFETLIKFAFLYFVFNGLTGLIYGMDSLLVPLYSFWYLPALIVWRLTAHRIAKLRYAMLILFAAALFGGFFHELGNTFAISRIIAFYPYYLAGYLLNSDDFLNKEKTRRRYLTGIGCTAAAGAMIFFAVSFFQYTDSAFVMFSYRQPLDAFGRIALYIIGFTAVYAIRCLAPDKNIPFLTRFGRNSLWIYVLHRPITLEAERLLDGLPPYAVVSASAALTFALCALLSCDPLAGVLNKFAGGAAEIFTPGAKSKTRWAATAAALLIALGFVGSIVKKYYDRYIPVVFTPDAGIGGVDDDDPAGDVIYRTITANEQTAFDNAFRITFAGDLILLEDQVKRAYIDNGYDFSDIFEYAKPHISSADLAIGVFEGPMAGGTYTTGNFDDGKELRLNFPDEFAAEVQRTGFDLVTTANNHLLDKGVDGALRTLDVLDDLGLDHTGSYRSAAEKEAQRVKTLEYGGIKFAVLSYTYGSNYIDTEDLAVGDLSYITSVVCGDGSDELFNTLKAEVERDFAEAKALDPDLIIVLPHMGTQFSNKSDKEQEAWFGIFKELGADIILGDHAHAVQPAFIETFGGKKVFTAYCPGNFANIYREKQGDTSALIDVYIDRATKEIIGGGIVPLYTQSALDGNFRALPLYDIQHNAELRSQLSTDDYERAKEAHSVVTRVMLGAEPDISAVTENYLFDENGFIRRKSAPVLGGIIDEKARSGEFYKALENARSVCFLGDSLTEGTRNGGVPWYEPIESAFLEKSFLNFSQGGCTISYLTGELENIPEAELYVIAVGTNDVRYRDPELCAMTAEEFTKRAEELRAGLIEKTPAAKVIFIAPWYSTDGDPFCELTFAEKTALNREFSDALGKYCRERSLVFIDPNPYIENLLTNSPDSRYLLDHIHPNASDGVAEYSKAVLYYES